MSTAAGHDGGASTEAATVSMVQPGAPAQPPGRADSGGDEDEASAQARITGRQLRESAHRYLDDGLLPVPAWAARQDGACCCPRGAGCPRPGKHPRSVRTGPVSGGYSWKPLACRTHAEVDRRFAPGGQYAAGNLMVAIPAGMMAIDRDDDDGGRAALARLAADLGELPPTVSHRTPHGEHLIFRTPPGWRGRAWVGKDPANPVPPGIDLRMPGQVLMAAPSVVPGADGPGRYGPLGGGPVAALPAGYVTAWTPPAPRPRPASRPVPVRPEGAGRAARYVHEAMTRIAADLASRPPGGRNAAAYAAGLKAGSLLGAARATPGAEQAAAAWSDEAAEDALLDAAERNGYTGKDGQAEARRAIRSGLRNGLASPRALPDFTTPRPAPARQQRQHQPAASGPARPQPGRAAAGPAQRTRRWQEAVPDDVRRQVQGADQAAAGRRRTAIAARQQAVERLARPGTRGPAAGVERTRAQAGAAIAAQREPPAGPAPGPGESRRMRANRAAVAANAAYRAGNLDQARQFTDQAAALDPSRAGLWQQHREQIAARRLILDARSAHARGDHQLARELLSQARQLDPRMPAVWDGGLPATPPARHARDAAAPGPGGTPATGHAAARETSGQHRVPAPAGEAPPRPSWPSAPARNQPRRPAPHAAPEADSTPSSAQRHAAAAPREPRAHPRTTAEDTQASAEPADSHPQARWPAPRPGTARQASPPGPPPSGEAIASERPAGTQQPSGTAAQRGPGGQDPHRPAPPADWRDQILSQARERWQPGPSWPHHPVMHRPAAAASPDAGLGPTPDTQIEPGR